MKKYIFLYHPKGLKECFFSLVDKDKYMDGDHYQWFTYLWENEGKELIIILPTILPKVSYSRFFKSQIHSHYLLLPGF